MSEKVKIQHYVPRSYLRHFTHDRKHLFIFDKQNKRKFETNVDNIAAEKYFYDSPDESGQALEKAFANTVDANYPRWVDSILNSVKSGKKINYQQKESLAFHIALQALRTRWLRNANIEILSQIEEVFLSFSTHFKKKQGIQLKPDASLGALLSPDKEKTAKLAQLASIKNPESIQGIVEVLLNHIWIVGINKTDQPFYTSDNPVVRWAHKNHPLKSYSGLRSEGVEIAFPLTPEYILALLERTYHVDLEVLDCGFMPVDENGVVYYNGLQVFDSHRWIFSPSADFTLAEKMCDDHDKSNCLGE
jgi:hypothetical protein